MTAVREERRLVTCMFVDVVGSTELVTRMGAERLKRELGNAFADISGVISAHGGTVEKYIGDAIYALFGAPIAHEDDPLRALRAAEAVREKCATGGEHGHPFTVRVGIETGEAVVDLEAAATTKQQMSVGPVVNIAARLQQRAEPGEILVGPVTREATDAHVELAPMGEIDLKGIGPIHVWKLLRTGVMRARVLPFVGRAQELALLDHAFQRASKGRSVLAVVSGPPGQGKTRLVQEFLRERSDRCRVIATRCRPADEVGVFAPVRDILGVTTLDELADQVGRLCRDDIECERVVAGLAQSAGIAPNRSLNALGAAEREDEIVQAWRRYIGLVGGDAFVALAIDDIHWADPSLVRLVDRLTFGGPRVLVVATARPEFAESGGIRPTGDRFFIELEGLELAEARRLAALAGNDDERVVARAEGNPLFVVELARSSGEGDLPLTLQGTLGARLDELDPTERSLLSLAAIVGERFTTAEAAFLAQRDDAEAARVLSRLADLHFLDETEASHRFHHGLIRDVAYGRLLSAERMRAHARFARECVRSDDVASRAHHWWEALRPPDAEWVWTGAADLPQMRRQAYEAHVAAGRTHADHFAIDRAIELFERALSFADDDRSRAEAEQAMGGAFRRVLRQDDAWKHLLRSLELYRALGAVPTVLYAEIVNSAQFIGAFKVHPDASTVEALANEGIAAARAAGDLGSLARILRSWGQFLINLDETQPERAEELYVAAIEAAEASGDADVKRATLLTRASQLVQAGRAEEAGALLREVAGAMDGADALERLSHRMTTATYHLLRGELDLAERVAGSAVELATPMGPHLRTHAWRELADIYVAGGQWSKLMDLAGRAADLMTTETASAFCRQGAAILRGGAIAHALAGHREDTLRLLRTMPRTDIELDLVSAAPRALLGFASPETDAKLKQRRWAWWEWEEAVFRALVLGRPDAAEEALAQMGRVLDDSPAYRAFGQSAREAIAELRGGPPATYRALLDLGLNGWAETMRRRVNAEY